MERYGYRGVAAVVTQNDTNEGVKFCLDCEREGQLSYEDIRRLQEEGWDIISHTHSHFALGDQLNSGRAYPEGTVYGDGVRAAGCWCCWSAECVHRELYLSRKTLEAEGITKGARFFAVPFGQDSATGNVFLHEVPKYYSLVTSCEPLAPMGLPLTSPYTLGMAPLHTQGMLDAIDRVCEYGGWLTLLFHDLAGAKVTEDFTRVIDYIRKKQLISSNPPMVVTFSDMYDTVISKTQETREVLPAPGMAKPTVVHSYSFTPTLGEAGCVIKIYARDRDIQVRLPSLARADGKEFIFHAADVTHPITITPYAGEKMRGALHGVSLAAQGDTRRVFADARGGEWVVTDTAGKPISHH